MNYEDLIFTFSFTRNDASRTTREIDDNNRLEKQFISSLGRQTEQQKWNSGAEPKYEMGNQNM
jgi:hypothetical protein